MSAISHTTELGAPQPRIGRSSVKLGVAALAAALVVASAWLWHSGAERRAIQKLQPDERRALYERTLGTLRAPCGIENHSEGLEAYCREQSEFIVQFPECDSACAALARQHLTPTR
jgi:cytochrome b pre-mRNA-processing protein 3